MAPNCCEPFMMQTCLLHTQGVKVEQFYDQTHDYTLEKEEYVLDFLEQEEYVLDFLEQEEHVLNFLTSVHNK